MWHNFTAAHDVRAVEGEFHIRLKRFVPAELAVLGRSLRPVLISLPSRRLE
jgi:hypothetical protein